jgi:hypothetical protein
MSGELATGPKLVGGKLTSVGTFDLGAKGCKIFGCI